MAFFGTPVKKLTFDDLDELVKTKAQENVRLEFKSAPVDRDEYLKKLSAFANTSGGYLILGIAEGPNSTARDVCGVAVQPSFEAQISSWCAQNLYPPIVPSVSNAIDVPGKGTFAYVIYVDESETAPHFIEGRKGCYIRTNETSHRFEAEPANLAEISGLLNRRAQAKLTFDALKSRSESRINHRQNQFQIHGLIGPTLPLTTSVRPAFPRKPVVELKSLADVISKSAVKTHGGQQRFPRANSGAYSTTDAFLFPSARHSLLSFLEVTRYGTSSYTEYFQTDPIAHEKLEVPNAAHVRFVRSMAEPLWAILLGLKFARNLITGAPVHGLLEIAVDLNSPAQVAFALIDPYRDPVYGAVQQSDQWIRIVREVQADEFNQAWKQIAFDIWRELYFSLGLDVAYKESGDEALKLALKYGLTWVGNDEAFLSS